MKYVFIIIMFLFSLICERTFSQIENSYRSVNHGAWNAPNGIWQVFRNGDWEDSGPPPGNANISIESNITCNGQLISGNLQISGYNNLYGSIVITKDGTFSSYGHPGIDIIVNNGTVNLSGVFKINKLENTNTGIVNILDFIGGGTGAANIINYGIINDIANNDRSTSCTYENYGTYIKKGVKETNLQGYFDNYGTVTIDQGILSVSPGRITNKPEGSLTIKKDSKIIAGPFGQGSMIIEDKSNFGGEGIIDITGILQVDIPNYTVPTSMELYLSGGELWGSSNLNIGGNFYWNGGTARIPITILSGGKVFLNSASLGKNSFTNYGTVSWIAGDLIVYDYPFLNYGTFEISTDGRYGIRSSYFNTYFENHGTLIKKSSGTTELDMVVQNKTEGKISGTGSLKIANLENDGIISPGLSPGKLEISSQNGILKNDIHAGILEIEIVNSNSVADFDELSLKGNLLLGGKLKVTSTGTIPAGSYNIVSGDNNLSGSFSEVELPEGFNVVYKDNNVILVKSSKDSDGDGVPDEADCAPNDKGKWQSASLFIDKDNDGYDNGLAVVCYGATIPMGYKFLTLGKDCNDDDASIHPGALEICGDGVDNNCDGQIDEDCIEAKKLFRSRQSGEWFNAGTWEYSTDGENWSTGTFIPSYKDSTILIRTGHEVEASSLVELDETTVEKGASLKLNSMRLFDGQDDDLLANGKLYLTGSEYMASGTSKIVVNDTLDFGMGKSALQIYPDIYFSANAITSHTRNTNGLYDPNEGIFFYGEVENEGKIFLYSSSLTFNKQVTNNNVMITRVSSISGEGSILNNGEWFLTLASNLDIVPSILNNGDIITSYTANEDYLLTFGNLMNEGNVQGIDRMHNNKGDFSGTFSPGSGQSYILSITDGTPKRVSVDSIGSLSILGSINNAGLKVDLSQAHGNDLLLASGNIDISGALTITETEEINPGHSFTIIKADGNISGRFNFVTPDYDVTYMQHEIMVSKPGGTEEICNGIDDDGDGEIDEGFERTVWYLDADGDGYGDPNVTIMACAQPAGYVSNNGDCDDKDSNTHPGAPEICDYKDNNCNGIINEGLGIIAYRDFDGDGYGNAEITYRSCNPTVPEGYVSNKDDCNDNDATIHPGAREICGDGKDNNCDGQIDESCNVPEPTEYYSKQSGDLHNLASWGTNPDGTGTRPADFGVDKTFNLANRGSTYTMTGNWTVLGTIVNTSGSQLKINGYTLSMTTLIGAGTLTGSSASSLTIEGTGDFGKLNFSTSIGGSLKALTVNRNGTVTIGTALGIYDVLAVNNGTLNTDNQLTLKSVAAGTARVAPVTGTISGNVTVERYIPARRAWRLMNAPVAGNQSINQAWQEGVTLFSTNPNPNPGYGTIITTGTAENGFDQNLPNQGSSLKALQSSPNTWVAINNTKTTPVNKSPYFIFIRGDRSVTTNGSSNTTLRATGPLLTGNQNIPIAARGFTAVANPFASPINFATITKNNVADAFYVWDPKMGGAKGVGAYVNISYNGTGYDITPASASPESQYIQSGQAFLVQSTGLAGSLGIKESDKLNAGSDNVFRAQSGNSNEQGLAFTPAKNATGLRINLQSANDSQRAVLDEVFASYSPNFSDNIDNMDALKAANVMENLAIIRKEQSLMVERRNQIQSADTLQLKLSNTSASTYMFEFSPIELGGAESVTLVDNYLKTTTDIKRTETSQVFFQVGNDSRSSATDRFSVIIANKKGSLVLNRNLDPTAIVYPNPTTSNQIHLKFDNIKAGAYTIELVNMAGQVIFRKLIHLSEGSSTHRVDINNNITSGIYQVRITGMDMQKVIKILKK